MIMQAQALILLIVMVFASLVATANRVQDEHCRSIAAKHKVTADLSKVASFKLYGQPRAPLTCQDQCEELGMDIGFDYDGKQACCCGKSA
jgi:hypothetical protein